jgi:hypothetical protein
MSRGLTESVLLTAVDADQFRHMLLAVVSGAEKYQSKMQIKILIHHEFG